MSYPKFNVTLSLLNCWQKKKIMLPMAKSSRPFESTSTCGLVEKLTPKPRKLFLILDGVIVCRSSCFKTKYEIKYDYKCQFHS